MIDHCQHMCYRQCSCFQKKDNWSANTPALHDPHVHIHVLLFVSNYALTTPHQQMFISNLSPFAQKIHQHSFLL